MKTITTLAITALFATTVAGAEVITKGGAAQLAKAPYSPTATTAPAAMPCPKCKSEFVTVNVAASKGTAPTATTVVRHVCPDCGTQWVRSGHGKGNQDSAVHTCSKCKG